MNSNPTPPTLYYDGECGLCSRAVRALVAIDSRDIFAIAPLQGEKGQAMLRAQGMDTDRFDTMIVEAGGKIYAKSDAVLEIFRQVGGGWRALTVGRVVPKSLRDFLYMLVSRNRLRIFGKADVCSMPSDAIRRKLARGQGDAGKLLTPDQSGRPRQP